ncbi:basement membrane-specific heparan sulfate proteoglycan core protein-like [Poeciliopsis prolifica]|uniref:basement membrane-specific heparan sulfate proteoglycan core protein-like n=1 Tax=Poeciliopsis prolifica TaxID=188132 RepID=UPI002413D682|nr:basement membrane-specific heparan sulfate proteoglycan core protein-like [Poeciliopsis prolifica]
MGHILLCVLGFFWFNAHFAGCAEVSIKPSVIQHPKWTQIYKGEQVTLTCEIQGGGGAEWTYEWRPANENSPMTNEWRIIPAVSGDYSCRAEKDDNKTEWSEALRLTVSTDKPRATLTADPTIIPAVGSTTLTCSVDGSDDWKFEWFRDDEPVQLRGTNEQQSDVSVSDGGVYSCRGRRGDPVYQTEESEEVSVLKTVSKPTVILQPRGSVVYKGEKVTLRCEIKEGGRTQWTNEWRKNNRNIQRRSSEYSINEVSEYHSGVYRCMATGDHQQTEWSDGITLTVKPYKPRATLTADIRIIPLEGSTTLTCSVDESDDWKFDWFRNDQQYSAARGNRDPNRVIYVSAGGEYSCRGRRKYSSFQTEISDKISVVKIVPKPTVNRQPSGSVVYKGEKVTLRCEIKEGGRTQWTNEWRKNNRNIQRRSSEYSINDVSEYHSGVYSCMAAGDHQQTEWSDGVTLTVKPDKPRATLTADRTIIPAGGSITLTCSVDESDDWKFDWFRNDQQYFAPRFRGNKDPFRVISVSERGLYSCRGGRGNPVFHTETSNIQKIVSAPTVKRHPSWPVVFRGETVTLRCEMEDDEGTQWTYQWSPANRNSPTSNEYRINSVSESDSGSYYCRASKGDQNSGWSFPFPLTVKSNRPKASLTASDNIIPAGGRVTLTCLIDIGVGWKFDWFKLESDSSAAQSIRTSESDGVLFISEGGEYGCRGGRGDPVFYTETSGKVTIEKRASRPQPVLSVSPSWPNPGASVTLSCEGLELQSAGWRFFWYKAVPNPISSSYSFELLPNTINGTEQNSFIINGPTQTAGYQCRAGRGEPKFYTRDSEVKFVWSADSHPAASLSVSPDRVQHFIDQSVTLNCSGNDTKWRVKRFTESTSPSYVQCFNWEMMSGSSCTINRLEVHSGVYWCESGSGEFSNAVNITVQGTVSSPVSSSFPGMLIVRLLVVITLGFLLLLMMLRCRQYLWCFRSKASSQSSTTNQGPKLGESQVYSSLLHGDASEYESIQPATMNSKSNSFKNVKMQRPTDFSSKTSRI